MLDIATLYFFYLCYSVVPKVKPYTIYLNILPRYAETMRFRHSLPVYRHDFCNTTRADVWPGVLHQRRAGWDGRPPLQSPVFAASDSKVNSYVASVTRPGQISDQRRAAKENRPPPPPPAVFGPRQLRLSGRFSCSFCITTRADAWPGSTTVHQSWARGTAKEVIKPKEWGQAPSLAEITPCRLRLSGKFICSFCITTRADDWQGILQHHRAGGNICLPPAEITPRRLRLSGRNSITASLSRPGQMPEQEYYISVEQRRTAILPGRVWSSPSPPPPFR
jgi:hypothetical protein